MKLTPSCLKETGIIEVCEQNSGSKYQIKENMEGAKTTKLPNSLPKPLTNETTAILKTVHFVISCCFIMFIVRSIVRIYIVERTFAIRSA
jgi:hypothetical protein